MIWVGRARYEEGLGGGGGLLSSLIAKIWLRVDLGSHRLIKMSLFRLNAVDGGELILIILILNTVHYSYIDW